MALQENNTIRVEEVISYFVSNVLNPIFSGAKSTSNVPNFSGTGKGGQGGEWVAYSNPKAIPSQDLKDYNSTYNTVSNSFKKELESTKYVDGVKIYNAIKNVANLFATIRRFDSNWYHQVGGNMNHIAHYGADKAVFKDSLPGLPKYAMQANTKKEGWERTANNFSSSFPDIPFNPQGPIESQHVIDYFNSIRNKWQELYNNTVTYKYFTCHQNCHSNCHGSRGRR